MTLKDPAATASRRAAGALLGARSRRRKPWERGDRRQAEWGSACCGVSSENGISRHAAPLWSWTVGLKIDRLLLWLKGRAGPLRSCFSPVMKREP